MPDLKRFRNFDEAKQYVLNTPPIRGRGSNIIPWSRDRRNPDTFNVRLTRDFDGKELVACNMHHTDILQWREDGAVIIEPYDSKTTRYRLNDTLPVGLSISTNGGKQFMYGNGETFVLPRPCNGIVFTRVPNTNTWTTTPEELGYLWGPGRKWVTPRVSAFMRTLQTQLRVSAKLLNDPALAAIDGGWQTYRAEDPEDVYRDLLAVMGDWKRGQSVDPDLYPDLLDRPRTGQWQDRLRRWSVLRWEPKGPGISSWAGLHVLNYQDHIQTQETLNEIRHHNA